jgi:putative transposase
MREVSNTSL